MKSVPVTSDTCAMCANSASPAFSALCPLLVTRHSSPSPHERRRHRFEPSLGARGTAGTLRLCRETQFPTRCRQLRDSGLATEAAILSTCNRVEIYAATALAPDAAFAELKKFLVAHHAYDGALGDELYTFAEPHSLHHLFKVAAGLDSMVIGETEIFGQLKQAYELAFTHKHTGARLNKAFQRAFNVAKHIRTETNIQRGSVSVMSAAVELAEKIFTSLAEHEVLVIGAGETSEKTARALLSRGARSIVVTNRSPERAAALAAELGGRAVPFEQWPEEFEQD